MTVYEDESCSSDSNWGTVALSPGECFYLATIDGDEYYGKVVDAYGGMCQSLYYLADYGRCVDPQEDNLGVTSDLSACWDACVTEYGDALVAVDGPGHSSAGECFCQTSCDYVACDGSDMMTNLGNSLHITLSIEFIPALKLCTNLQYPSKDAPKIFSFQRTIIHIIWTSTTISTCLFLITLFQKKMYLKMMYLIKHSMYFTH